MLKSYIFKFFLLHQRHSFLLSLLLNFFSYIVRCPSMQLSQSSRSEFTRTFCARVRQSFIFLLKSFPSIYVVHFNMRPPALTWKDFWTSLKRTSIVYFGNLVVFFIEQTRIFTNWEGLLDLSLLRTLVTLTWQDLFWLCVLKFIQRSSIGTNQPGRIWIEILRLSFLSVGVKITSQSVSLLNKTSPKEWIHYLIQIK